MIQKNQRIKEVKKYSPKPNKPKSSWPWDFGGNPQQIGINRLSTRGKKKR